MSKMAVQFIMPRFLKLENSRISGTITVIHSELIPVAYARKMIKEAGGRICVGHNTKSHQNNEDSSPGLRCGLLASRVDMLQRKCG
jgi:hypothetical protein